MRRTSWFLAILTLSMVTLSGPAAAKVPLIYQPEATKTTQSYFANGQPFAITTADSSVVMLVMSPEKISGYKYIRVWCLYYNKSSEPVLFNPAEMAHLQSTKIGKAKTKDIPPESPTAILERISDEMANREILQTIGAAAASLSQSMNTRPTTITGGGNAQGTTWTVNDGDEKRQAAQDRVARKFGDALERTQTYYDLYKASVSGGILRRNTVFPGTSVNGYIYFPSGGNYAGGFSDFNHLVELHLPHDTIQVAFAPAAGE